METKDYLTIVISLIALLTSVVATVLSLRKKNYEEERTSRLQLNDTIGKIIGTRIEHAKYATDHPDVETNFATSAVLGTINYQMNSFARLAVYIAEKIPHLVTDIEYATVADAFGWTGDQPKALQYQNAAIEKSKEISRSDDKHSEVFNRRSFANYLFTIGNVGAGREQYESALRLTPVKDDYSKYVTGYTHRMWGTSEGYASFPDEANDHFNKAEATYKTISNENIKNPALNDIAQVRQAIQYRGNVPIKPGSLPMGPTGPTGPSARE